MLTIDLYKTTHIPLSILQFILLKYHDNSFFIIIIIFLKTSPNRPTHSPRRHLYPQPQTHWQLQPQTTPATKAHLGNHKPMHWTQPSPISDHPRLKLLLKHKAKKKNPKSNTSSELRDQIKKTQKS